MMPPARVPVIGLAGGIGSGKSEVARRLARRGAVVSDSDAQARALLREPAIADILVRWWGGSILGPDGLPDRSAVAAVVFKDPAQRRRLEGLVHPVLASQRRAALRRAARAVPPAPLFVVDAPLLYEAGLDRECDAVLFVAAPREVRLRRAAARGWSESELMRREAAQLPLTVKQARSTFMIDNGDLPAGELDRQISAVWPRLLAARAGRKRRA